MAKRVERTRSGNQWTEARYRAFIKSLLRSGTLRWGPRNECLKKAYVKTGINPKTKRKAKLYRCEHCGELFSAKDMRIDHIDPIVDPSVGFVDWDTYIERMFCEVDNFQALCKKCHDKKTKHERETAKGLTRNMELGL